MFISPAYAQAASPFGGDSMLVSLLPFILIFVIMYFLILRPQQKRQKQHQEMVKNVRRGDTVITSGGLVGKVTKVTDDEQIEVEVASRIGGLLPGERPDEAKPFHPHLTLARVKTEVGAVDWPAILEAAPVSDVGSLVGHVSLFRSRGLPGGAGYEEIARGRLGG